MKRFIAAFAYVCTFAFAQSPPCIQISDSNVWAVGNTGANGTIRLSIGYRQVTGDYTYPQSDTLLTVTAGTVYGPDGTPGYCAPAGSTLMAVYQIRRTGPGTAGAVSSTTFWSIPSSGGPLRIKDVEISNVPMEVPQPPSTGTYCLTVINGIVAGPWSASCASSGASILLSTLTNGQLATLSDGQLSSLQN